MQKGKVRAKAKGKNATTEPRRKGRKSHDENDSPRGKTER